MEAKEKAQELVERFLKTIDFNGYRDLSDYQTAKTVALMAVEEIISENQRLDDWTAETAHLLVVRMDYWQSVKKEIENL